MFKAVVYSPGRTGSLLIAENLCHQFNVPFRQDLLESHICLICQNNIIDIDGAVIHTHNPHYIPPFDDGICVLSKRGDKFDNILSLIVAEHTKQRTVYENVNIEPFIVTEDMFKLQYWFVTNFFKHINTGKFKQVIEIKFEELMSKPSYLFTQFGIFDQTNYSLIDKSPYNNHMLIKNLKEIRRLYDKLEGGA